MIMRFIIRRAPAALVVLCLVVPGLTGCGPSDARGLVPVSGRITLNGGGWPKPGNLTFLPVSEPALNDSSAGPIPTRVGFAEFDREGAFVAQSRRPGDGLMPGRYRVGVSCWDEEPDMASEGKGPIAPEVVRDAAKSPLIAEIPPMGTKNLILEVQR